MTRDELAAAFRNTTYRVIAAPALFDLRIGVGALDFDAFLRQRGVSCWALLTACNPGGVRSEAHNARYQRRLLERVQAAGRDVLPALNLADDDAWPPEPGVFLPGVSADQARALAAEFRQLACVCGDTGAAPRLVWTEPDARSSPAS